MTTIVSAFVSNINSKKDMDIFKYYQNGKLLLRSNVPKIIFLDECLTKFKNNQIILNKISH